MAASGEVAILQNEANPGRETLGTFIVASQAFTELLDENY
jgi:hypothetical protein